MSLHMLCLFSRTTAFLKSRRTSITRRLMGLCALNEPFLDRQSFVFENARLQEAVKVYEEARKSAAQGAHATACEDFSYGIMVGRPVVLELQASRSETEDEQVLETSQKALDWLIASYLFCGRSRMALEEWDMARKDFWAASMYSQNQDLIALQSMYELCVATEDDLGQLTSLKSLERLLRTEDLTPNPPVLQQEPPTLEDVQEKIQVLEAKLQADKS